MHHKIVKILALLIGTEAVIVMTGWILGIDSLTRFLPSGINMKFPTAASFLFSAIGLYFISRATKYDPELSRVVLPGIALVIFLMNTYLLLAGLFGIPTGLEILFVQEASPVFAEGSGLPALNTILCFILFASACVVALFPGPEFKSSIRFLGYTILVIGFISIVGYALRLPALYLDIVNSVVPMALNTAVFLVLLGFGLVVTSKAEFNNEA